MKKGQNNNQDEEIFFEPDADSEDVEFEQAEEMSKDKIKKLREDLKESQKKATENMDGWQRALADYANLQKTSAEQVKDLKGYILEGFVEELLPTLDAFEMAMKNKDTWESVNENWRKGMEYIFEQLKGVLRNNGVEDVGMVGEKFNPDTHHAIEEIETDDESKDGTVSDVVQKGYKGAKGVIRPAKVKIYKHKA